MVATLARTSGLENDIPFLIDSLTRRTHQNFVTMFLRPTSHRVLRRQVTTTIENFNAPRTIGANRSWVGKLTFSGNIASARLRVLVAHPRIRHFMTSVGVRIGLITFMLI